MKRFDPIFAIIILFTAVLVIICTSAKAAEQPETTQEATTMATTEETTLAETEPTETTAAVTEPQETTPPVILYDVPLSEELQLHIIAEAEAHGIDPAIIFAMAYRESTYDTDGIGDSGASYGLLQVQPRWHRDRMERLGCTDLLDPFQNVTVAVDYLAEQIDRYNGDVMKALVAYNRGHYEGTITGYARNVMSTAEELRGDRK